MANALPVGMATVTAVAAATATPTERATLFVLEITSSPSSDARTRRPHQGRTDEGLSENVRLPSYGPFVVSSLGLALRMSRKEAAYGNRPRLAGLKRTPECLDQDYAAYRFAIPDIRCPFGQDNVHDFFLIEVYCIARQEVGAAILSPPPPTPPPLPRTLWSVTEG
ncbi:hypothetical protein GCM10010394_23040 [Streptomyces crystallinus]|uniref:Secreted protein n=1 Tax=Streptomyces crystallinus TaxID=68191 RepID=A0ABP3QLB3_9ACTN